MDNNKLIEYIQKDSPNPGDRLSPENIRKMLEKQPAKRKSSIKKIGIFSGAATVAVALLVVMLVIFTPDNNQNDKGAAIPQNSICSENMAVSYSNIYSNLKKASVSDNNYKPYDKPSGNGVNDSVIQNNNYLDTNVQVNGIDELTTVKTDGEYIYSVNDHILNIFKTENGEAALVNSIDIAIPDKEIEYMNQYSLHGLISIMIENGMVSEDYFTDNRGTILGIYLDEEVNRLVVVADYSYKDYPWTVTLYYNIDDPDNVFLYDTKRQSGQYTASRYFDGYLYIMSDFKVYYTEDESDYDKYVPQNSSGYITPDNIYINDEVSEFCVLTSIDMSLLQENTIAGMDRVDDMYVNEKNIYTWKLNADMNMDEEASADYKDTTTISKIGYNEGAFSFDSNTAVNGSIDSPYSVNEYDGYIRIVTSAYEYQNNSQSENDEYQESIKTCTEVHIFDSDMKEVGYVTDIAPDEKLHGVNFYGSYAYIVTFYQTDPLFCVDLSDVEKPVVTDELSISGYSDYITAWNENELLGIGLEASNDGMVTGIKTSIFDVSDPSELAVKDSQSIDFGGYVYTPFSNDPAKLLIDRENGIYGFSYTEYAESPVTHYAVYSYNGDSLELLDEYEVKDECTLTGIRIGEFIYVISDINSDTWSYSIKK